MQLVKDEADPFESPIEIRVLRPDESIALSVTGKMTFKDGDTLNVAINVSVLLDVEGRWSVEALLDSAGLAVTHELRVQLQSPA